MPFFPDVAHRHNYPVTCLDHICLQVYYMLHKTVSEMNPFTSYPAAKHRKRNKFAIIDMREKPADLFLCTTRASTSAPAIILLTYM